MYADVYNESSAKVNESLKVWGDLTEPVERLLRDLARCGWHPEPCGWPQGDCGPELRRDQVQLIALDGTTTEELDRLQPLLNAGDSEEVFVCHAHDLERDEVRSMLAKYAYGYQCLPGDAWQLDTILRQAWSMAALHCTHSGSGHAATRDRLEYGMVGTGPAMLDLFEAIRKVAAVDEPVLLRGESGTGKELAARAIHAQSARAAGPFVAVNCAALPAELVQSELFGYEEGAFTDASKRHIGHIEAADGGTLLLDEIGDLPLSQQVSLLRFLETGTIYRVGGSAEVAVDVRILAATHAQLEQALRDDLYYRLNVVSLRIPPLRERIEDIEVLARLFMQRYVADRRRRVRGIRGEALRRMYRHNWPGNVRELENDIRRAVVLGNGRLISSADLGFDVADSPAQAPTLKEARARVEREQVHAALLRNRHVFAPTARELGISRVTLYRLLDKYQLGHSSQGAESMKH